MARSFRYQGRFVHVHAGSSERSRSHGPHGRDECPGRSRYFAIEAAYFDGGVLSFAEHWGLRIEFAGIDVSDGDFYMLAVSGLYRF